ncbi:MAG TPA: TrmJ/YjtD family RNA methyltransferase [Terriglobia bacterium]|nr:TrmJ/YjtD family RNA methyltransferase [Terriglobia bacterium]
MSAKGFNWRVVLVRPRNPLNIGAAARAMANFGFIDLRVVEPHPPVWREARSAVGAEAVVRAARAAETLTEAIGDATLVVGTTSGQRRTLDRELVSLDDLPAWVCSQPGLGNGGRAAILFGSEKTGLSNENLSYCHVLVRIPTLTRCPSMNLGQAVAVCCYELARARRYDASAPEKENAGFCVRVSTPANAQSLEHIFERATRVLDGVGYLKPKSRAARLIKLRRMLIERQLSNHDAKILGGVLAQIEWKLGQR